ncbi:uncharacterized protein [Fopius arisanus]|uniref:Uncharacterized protein n=1 Tax=Fopius arisanus TaxID=64838 RepID=A0A9R1TQ52_9HYME|nr:PREDICTED: uncharacterized protein LOC105272551 [Fopius arisanus]
MHAIESISSSDGKSEIGNVTDSDDDDDTWDASTPLDTDTISPDGIVESPASPDLEAPEGSAAGKKGIVDFPASPDHESPESSAPEEKGLVDSPASPDPESLESAAPEDSHSMEMDPPDSTISEVAPVILANVGAATPPISANDTEPFVRVGEVVCPPADEAEPIRIFIPEEWEGVMPERAMKKKRREIINRHYQVGGTFVTMGDVRAKLIFCPHGNIYFRPMGSFTHPKRLLTNIKIYPEL